MPDFRVGGISSRYFNLQGIRDRLQVKTPSLEPCAALPVSLGFKRLARGLHACSQIVSRDCMGCRRLLAAIAVNRISYIVSAQDLDC